MPKYYRMARIKKYGDTLQQPLSNYQTYINDTAPNSEYFRISEFKDTLTGGKNGFYIEGSEFLKPSTELKIQVLDVNGDPVYFEPYDGTPEYFYGIAKPVAIYVYADTPYGMGSITIMGELSSDKLNIPIEWQGVYNVKWQRDFKIVASLPNEDRVLFYNTPEVTITELAKTVYSTATTTTVQSGSVSGIPLVPIGETSVVGFTLPQSYRLDITDSATWDKNIVGTTLQIPSLGYSPKVVEIVTDKTAIVNTPYTSSNLVKPFTAQGFTASYTSTVQTSASEFTGSFAKFVLTNLETAIGDVARLKVYRKSTSQLGDYTFVEDLQLESNELLTDLDSTTTTKEYYGLFTDPVISSYWVSSSNATTTFNQSYLYNSAKLHVASGTGSLHTSASFNDLATGVEYTLKFNVRCATTSSGALTAYLSGSNTVSGVPTTQTIITLPAGTAYYQKTVIEQNIQVGNIDNAVLYFDVNAGTDWYISDVSLKASQETSFSPDSITFIEAVPRTLPTETFDFRFQFYDVNNNHIPVVLDKSATFSAGNIRLAGQNAITSDLSNEFDLIATDAYGYSGSYVNTATTMSIYDGYTDVTSRWSFAVPTLSAGVTADISADNRSTIVTDMSSDSGTITFVATRTSYPTQTGIYKISKIKGGISGSTGAAGYDARAVALKVTPSTAVTFNSAGTLLSPTTLAVTASSYNTSSVANYTFYYDNKVIQARSTDNTLDYSLVGQTFTTLTGSLEVELTEGADTTTIYARDEVALVALKPGQNSITVALSNTNHTFGADSTGSVYTFTDSGTTITVYEGTTALTYVSASVGNGQWTATTSSINITPGSISGHGTTTATVANHSTLIAASASITYNITAKSAEGISLYATSSQYFNRSDDGANAYNYSLLLSTKEIISGSTYSPTSLAISSSYTDGTSTTQFPYAGIIRVTPGDGTIFTTTAGTSSFIYTLPTGLTLGERVKIELFAAGGTTQLLDVETVPVLGQGLDGQDGSTGVDARSVSLTSTVQAFTYNTGGLSPVPTTTYLTASVVNTSGSVSYLFYKDDVAQGSWTGSQYWLYTAPAAFTDMPDKIEVHISEDGGSTVLARDQFTIYGIKPGRDGVDSLSVTLSNEAHTLPTTNTGFTNYTGSGTDITIYQGTIPLTYNGTGSLNGTWTISAVGTNITSSLPVGHSTYVTYGDHSGMTQTGGYITYTITGKTTLGVDFSLVKAQSFAKSVEGASAKNIKLIPSATAIHYDSQGGENTTIEFTTETYNTTGTLTYNFIVYSQPIPYVVASFTSASILTTYFDSASASYVLAQREPTIRQSGSLSTYELLTIDEPGIGQTTPVKVELYENGVLVSSDSVTIYSFQDGQNAISVALSNENVSITTDSQGNNGDFRGSGTTITVYDGTTEVPYDGVGTTFNTWKLITDAHFITPGSTTSSGSYITIGDATAMTQDAAWINYTVSGSTSLGKSIYMTKRQSFAKAKGSPATVTMQLSNVTHTLPASSSGVVSSYDGSGTMVYVYYGTRPLSYATTPANDTWRFSSIVDTNIESGSMTDGGSYVEFGNASNMLDVSDAATIQFNVTGSTSEGVPFSVSTTQGFVKAKSGVDGVANYVVVNSVQQFKYADGVTIPVPTGITASAALNGNLSNYNWQYNSASTWTNLPGTINTSTYIIDPDGAYWLNGNLLNIRCLSDSYYDETSIAKLSDGTKARSVNITSPTQSFVYDSDGILTGENTTTVTATAHNTVNTPYYTFYLNGISVQAGTADAYAYTAPTSYGSIPQLIKVELRETSGATPLLATDQMTIGGLRTGAQGSAGDNARSVNLTTTTQGFIYNTNGDSAFPATATITATGSNTVGTVYYNFFKNGVSEQNDTTNTYTYTPQSTYGSMPDIVEVHVREGAGTGTILARDQITLYGIKAGTDAITIISSNEAHTLPVTNTGVVTYTNSGTTLSVYGGTEQFVVDQNSPYGTGSFHISAVGTYITASASTGSDGGTTIIYGDHYGINPTQNTAKVTYTITVKNKAGVENTFTKVQSLSKSVQGASGSDGTSTFKSMVFLRTGSQPDIPTGGTYASPIPTSTPTWTDGVPVGSASLWMSTRIFTATGVAPQQATWTTASQATSTSGLTIQFSADVTSSTPPAGNWSTTASTASIWMATQTTTNGVASSWQISKIKGEQGIPGITGSVGASGSSGVDAKGVTLTTFNQAFTYNAIGSIPSPATTYITASAYNTSSTANYLFYKNNVASGSVSTYNTYLYTPQSSYSLMPDVITVELYSSGSIVARDQITMFGVKPGTDSLSTILSNEAHTLSTTNTGIVDYVGSGTTIKVYQGATELQFVPYTTANGQWDVIALGTNIVAGGVVVSGMNASVADHIDMTSNSAYVTYTIVGKTAEGTAFTIPKIQSLTKSVQGIDGTVGQAARAIKLTPSTYVIHYDAIGGETDTITFSTETFNTTGSLTYNFIVYTASTGYVTSSFASGSESAATYFTASAPSYVSGYRDGIIRQSGSYDNFTLADSDEPVLGQTTPVKVELYENGNLVASDSVAIYTVQDGADGITIDLDNQMDMIATDAYGNGGSYVNAYTTASIYKGGVADSSNWYWLAPVSSSGLTASISNGNRSIKVTGLSTDIGWVTFNATSSFYSSRDVTYNISKMKSGVAGTSGSNGYNARAVSLEVNPTTAITFNDNGVLVSPTLLSVTASAYNTASTANYTFYYDNKVVRTRSTVPTLAYSLTSSIFTTLTGSLEVELTEGADTTTIYARDDVALVALKPSKDAISVVLNNEAHTFGADSTGSVKSYVGSGTTIQVYEGTTALTYNTTGVANGTWTFTSASVNITPGTSSGAGTTIATISEHSRLLAASASITYTVRANSIGSGTAYTSSKVQTFARSDDGATARNYKLVLSSTNVISSSAYSPTSIAISASYVDGQTTTLLPYVGRFKVYVNGVATYSVAEDRSNLNYIIADYTKPTIGQNLKVELHSAGGTTQLLDSETVPVIGEGQQGVDSTAITLTNYVDLVPTDAYGNGTYTGYGTIVDMYKGGTLDNTNWNFQTGSKTNVVATFDTASRTLSVSNVTSDSGSVTLTAIHKTSLYSSASVQYNISKNRQGSAAKNAILNSTSYIRTFDATGSLTLPTQTFILSATASNHSGSTIYYEFLSGSVQLQNTTVSSYTITGSSLPTVAKSVTYYVKTREGSNSSTIIATDSLSILGIKDNASSVTVQLTNENHTFPANSSGDVTDFTNSGTEIRVYDGVTLMNYDGTGTSTGTWKVTATPTDIGVGSLTGHGTYLTVAPMTSIASSTGIVRYTVTGTTYLGATFTQSRIQSFSKAFTGAIGGSGSAGINGPGVVYTGLWESGSRVYNFTSGSTGRRDIVLWSSGSNTAKTSYYAARQTHATSLATSPSSSAGDAYWEPMGSQSLFVAAKIGLFEESFIQNTLNIGTNNNGGVSSANITLHGGDINPYISLGQTTHGYGEHGGYFGNTGGTVMLSLVSGSSNFLKWNGRLLDVAGKVTATEGVIGGWSVVTNTLKSSGSFIELNSDNNTISVRDDNNNVKFIVNTSASLPTFTDFSYTTRIPEYTSFSGQCKESTTLTGVTFMSSSNIPYHINDGSYIGEFSYVDHAPTPNISIYGIGDGLMGVNLVLSKTPDFSVIDYWSTSMGVWLWNGGSYSIPERGYHVFSEANYKGEYDSVATYDIHDIVLSMTDGYIYINGIAPPSSPDPEYLGAWPPTPPSGTTMDTEYWYYLGTVADMWDVLNGVVDRTVIRSSTIYTEILPQTISFIPGQHINSGDYYIGLRIEYTFDPNSMKPLEYEPYILINQQLGGGQTSLITGSYCDFDFTPLDSPILIKDTSNVTIINGGGFQSSVGNGKYLKVGVNGTSYGGTYATEIGGGLCVSGGLFSNDGLFVNSGSYFDGTIETTLHGTSAEWNGKQSELSGTGFIKASGTAITYDNSIYANTSGSNTFVGNQKITGSAFISGGITVSELNLNNVASINSSGTTNTPFVLANIPITVASVDRDNFRDLSTINASAGGGFASYDTSITVNSTTQNHANGFQERIKYGGTGTLESSNGFMSQPDNLSTGTIGSRTAFKAEDYITNNGTVGLNIGFGCANLTKGTSNWAFYSVGTVPSYFGGKTFVGYGGAYQVPANYAAVFNVSGSVSVTGGLDVTSEIKTGKHTIKGVDSLMGSFSYIINDSNDRPVTTIDNSGRINLIDYSGSGAVACLYNFNTTTGSKPAGHYAMGTYNDAGNPNTVGYFSCNVTDDAHDAMNSRLSLGFMHNADTSTGYTQPNTFVEISSTGFNLPTIPLTGVSYINTGVAGVADGDVRMMANTQSLNAGSSLIWEMAVGGGNQNSILAQIKPCSGYAPENHLDFYVGSWNNDNDPGEIKMTLEQNGDLFVSGSTNTNGISTAGNSTIKFDTLSHTIDAGDILDRRYAIAWAKAASYSIMFISAGISDGTDASYGFMQSGVGGADFVTAGYECTLQGGTLCVYPSNDSEWSLGSIIRIFIVYI